MKITVVGAVVVIGAAFVAFLVIRAMIADHQDQR